VTPTGPHIETHDAWVEFPIFDAKSRSLKKTFLGGSIGRNASNVVVIEALRDITMSLELGDRVGLVGHNGAGKSTLLRLLSGIYEPTRGSAIIRGRVAPVFDLGVGMDPEISGYENIIIRGLFLGQTRKQMLAKVDEIADFTELGDYLSMPLRTYSTGMRVRLAAQGEVGPGGGPAGDLYVEIHEQPHDIFVRDGDDLHCTISVPMVDAALGTTVTVDAIIDGLTEITFPAGTQPGSVTTRRGHGMPHLRSGARGDLHVHVEVVVPDRIDHNDAELLREFKSRRGRDVTEVRSTHAAATNGGLFSRLRETFTGR